jgi:hypothetical protein
MAISPHQVGFNSSFAAFPVTACLPVSDKLSDVIIPVTIRQFLLAKAHQDANEIIRNGCNDFER